ncbi:hypothetical protein GCM10011371_04320 [Novosphingobium marinum]|nr:hypothetical protein GCM10011371_04320 [Novosphingobium marinum]
MRSMSIAVKPLALALASCLALAACNQQAGESEDDFEIVVPTASPTPAVEPGTVTDPAASTCGAPDGAEFVGQTDTPEVRDRITAALGEKAPAGIRFVTPNDVVTMDNRADRLNVMIDTTGVIRDLRCG